VSAGDRAGAGVALLALAVLALPACSGLRAPVQGGGFGGGSDGPFALNVRAVNQFEESSIEIYLVSDGGSRELLGTVESGGEQVFSLEERRPRGNYRLGAEREDGHRIPSEPFRLNSDATVHWHVPDGPLHLARSR